MVRLYFVLWGIGVSDCLLSIRGLRVRFGGVEAVAGVDLSVREGQIVGLIGPNGAGKTTLFDCISGFVSPDAGSTVFDGRDISRLSAAARSKAGLIRSFQDPRLFPSLTVEQSVLVAMEKEQPSKLVPTMLVMRGERRREHRRVEQASEVIQLLGLDGYRESLVSELSTGTRRIVDLACVLALDPRLILLDEPSSGIAQREVEALGGLLRRVQNYTSCTMLIIEHDMPLIMDLATEIVALESGRVIAQGSPEDVQKDEKVLASYLGADTVAVSRSGPMKESDQT